MAGEKFRIMSLRKLMGDSSTNEGNIKVTREKVKAAKKAKAILLKKGEKLTREQTAALLQIAGNPNGQEAAGDAVRRLFPHSNEFYIQGGATKGQVALDELQAVGPKYPSRRHYWQGPEPVQRVDGTHHNR